MTKTTVSAQHNDLPRITDDSSSEYETSDEEEGEKYDPTKEDLRQNIKLKAYWDQYGQGLKDNKTNPRADVWKASNQAVNQNKERIVNNKRKDESMLDSLYGKKWRDQTGYDSYFTGQKERIRQK